MRQAAADQMRTPVADALRRALHLKGSSLVMTLFGDAIAERGQSVWLSGLIKLARPFGLSARLVRTSVYRLVADDWLLASREGRRSHYRLSPSGARRVRHAQQRIYNVEIPPVDTPGSTLLMISCGLKASARQQLQRELLWNGYGEIAEGVYAHTRADRACLKDILLANRACDHVCVMQANLDARISTRPLHALRASRCCAGRLEQAWQRFIERFAPVLASATEVSDHEAFLIRILLVHEFRRILQRQPILRNDHDCHEQAANQARKLFTKLYQQLFQPSERFLDLELLDCPSITPRPAGAHRCADELPRSPAYSASGLH